VVSVPLQLSPARTTFYAAFAEVASAGADRVCLRYEPAEFTATFRQLREASELVATVLAECGVGPNDRVMVIAANDPSFYALLLAASAFGFVIVPLNPKLSDAEVLAIAQDAEPKVVIVDDLGARFEDRFACPVLHVDRDIAAAVRRSSADAVRVQADAANKILLQMYTSGTTGRAKGVLISESNVLAVAAEGIANLGQFVPDDRCLVCLPLFHIAGIDWLIFGLLSGAESILTADPRPHTIIGAVKRHAVTKILLVPAVIRAILTELEDTSDVLETVSTLCFGASAMPEDLVERARRGFPAADLIHVYGMTETCGMVTFMPPEGFKDRRILSCGRVFDSGRIAILSPNAEQLPANVAGEIVYAGPQCSTGYWKNDEATALLLRDGWLHTGDVGFLDEEGFLFVCDRIKDMIKSGDENVYPAEVENVLSRHPDVRDVAVIGLPDPIWGEAVCAVVVPKGEATLSLEKIRAFAKDDLAAFKLPKILAVLDELPRNAAGKVIKDGLRRSLRASRMPTVE
jgi:long-chain acyl-CoA synthetase